MTTQHQQNSTRWVSFVNLSNEDIPSYGVFCVSDIYYNDADKKTLIATRYETRTLLDDPEGLVDGHYGFDNDYRRVFAINGRSPVAAGKIGMCTFAYDGPAWARWKPDIDAPNEPNALEIQDQVGPHPNSFGMTGLGFGFRVIQYAEAGSERIFVQQMKPEVPVPVFVISKWVTPRNPNNIYSVAGLTIGPGLSHGWVFGYVLNSGAIEISRGGILSGASQPQEQFMREGSEGRKNCIAVQVDPTNCPALPCKDGMVIMAQWRDLKFYQVGGGCDYWAGCDVIYGALPDEYAVVDLRSGRAPLYTVTDQNYYVTAKSSDPTLSIPTGSKADVVYSRADGLYYVVAIQCS